MLADEYEKIMSFCYGFLLENDEMISFRFTKRHFHHLLGFHYLKYSTADKLIEYNYIDKEEFFKHVFTGNISYDDIKIEKIITNGATRNRFINMLKSEHEESLYVQRTYKSAQNEQVAELNSVIEDRWKCFSLDKVMDIFGEEIVLNYENDDSDDIKGAANKIFFRFLKEKRRHLNLIVGFELETQKYYPMSFFLEARNGKFFYKDDGTEQEKLKILVKFKYDSNTNKLIETIINWNAIRSCLLEESEIDILREIKTIDALKKYNFITSSDIKALLVEAKLKQIKEMPLIYVQMHDKKKALEYLERYTEMKTCNSKRLEEIILNFYSNNIEIDNDDVKKLFEADYKHKFLVQYTKYVEFYNTILQMEKREVRFIYEKFFDTTLDTWTEEFVEDLICKYKCFENSISLDQIGHLVSQTPKVGNLSL